MAETDRRLPLRELYTEPFRLFFPLATVVGIFGAIIWPLHFAEVIPFYPGTAHTRLMAHGFFGGFIFGFFGTAFPRLVGGRRFSAAEIGSFLALYLLMVLYHSTGRIISGDVAFLGLLVLMTSGVIVRLRQRKDVPPPGFVLVGLALVSAGCGCAISILEARGELSPFWPVLKPLLMYQGFILLPVLGVGAFILPRFYSRKSSHDFERSPTPPPGWWRKVGWASGAGLVILGSFVLEAAGWYRLAYLLRFVAIGAYAAAEVPFLRWRNSTTAVARCLTAGLYFVLAGFLFVGLFPVYRTALLHLTYVGGLAVITLSVGTRVIFGHSGASARLGERNRWFVAAVGLILFAMATRMSGDFWPRVMASHYTYGAVLWVLGIGVWAWRVMPRIWLVDPED